MLSAIVITKNEQKMIGDCLRSVSFADERIVVDTGNTDATNEISAGLGANIVKSSGNDYSLFRNDGLLHATGDWVLYVDADERVTPQLQNEIQLVISSQNPNAAYAIPRKNIYLGKPMHYGGWGDDQVIRLFKRDNLKGYQYPLHEQPVFTGTMAKLNQHLVHFSHRDLTSMLNKTLEFTAFEAKLRFDQNHPQLVWWRFIRVMFTEFFHRFIRLSAWRDGVEGVIDGIFQVFNTFVIYARLWELQQKRS